jgi:hypothetical protein
MQDIFKIYLQYLQNIWYIMLAFKQIKGLPMSEKLLPMQFFIPASDHERLKRVAAYHQRNKKGMAITMFYAALEREEAQIAKRTSEKDNG